VPRSQSQVRKGGCRGRWGSFLLLEPPRMCSCERGGRWPGGACQTGGSLGVLILEDGLGCGASRAKAASLENRPWNTGLRKSKSVPGPSKLLNSSGTEVGREVVEWKGGRRGRSEGRRTRSFMEEMDALANEADHSRPASVCTAGLAAHQAMSAWCSMQPGGLVKAMTRRGFTALCARFGLSEQPSPSSQAQASKQESKQEYCLPNPAGGARLSLRNVPAWRLTAHPDSPAACGAPCGARYLLPFEVIVSASSHQR
jgi:hypothetical protein